jgi:hypothetical protein
MILGARGFLQQRGHQPCANHMPTAQQPRQRVGRVAGVRMGRASAPRAARMGGASCSFEGCVGGTGCPIGRLRARQCNGVRAQLSLQPLPLPPLGCRRRRSVATGQLDAPVTASSLGTAAGRQAAWASLYQSHIGKCTSRAGVVPLLQHLGERRDAFP